MNLLVALLRVALVVAGATTAALAAAQPVTVRFEADLREAIAAGRFDPARDALGLRGSAAPLSWDRSLPMQPVGDSRFVTEVRFDKLPFGNQPLQYKFRIDRAGFGTSEGWEQGRNHPLMLDRPRIEIARAFDAPPAAPPRLRAGRFESLGVVPSKHVGAREVEVWLPPGYGSDPARRHPVLYLHDGQNVFDALASGAEWQADETAERLVRAGAIEPPIIVAVHSTRERVRDYTPTSGSLHAALQAGQQGGGAAGYARFLVEELKPLVDARFRTLPAREHTAVGGSSLGGLVSLWLALHRGETFGAALVVSPSLWWDGGFALRDLKAQSASRRVPRPLPRLWLDMGGREGDAALDQARAMRDALAAAGWAGPSLAYTEQPEGAHDEASWASRFEAMLQFLYGRRPHHPPRQEKTR